MNPHRAFVTGIDRLRDSPQPVPESSERLPDTRATEGSDRQQREKVEEQPEAVQNVHGGRFGGV